MHRNRISNAGGQTFFEKFRNGINGILTEVGKLEHIAERLDKPLDTTYFACDLDLLENLNILHEDVYQLFTTVSEQPVNIDPIEERLLAIREKLVKLEDNPTLIKKGYKPYIPPEIATEVPANASVDDVATELSFSSSFNGNHVPESVDSGPATFISPLSTPSFKKPTYVEPKTPKQVTELMSTLSLSSSTNGHQSIPSDSGSVATVNSGSSTVSVTLPKKEPTVNDPKIANCLNILKRWNTVSDEDHKDTNKDDGMPPADSFPRNTTFVMSKPVATPLPLKPVSKFKQTGSINRSKTFTMESKPKQFGNGATVEYETVEFTPGMTSKVRK